MRSGARRLGSPVAWCVVTMAAVAGPTTAQTPAGLALYGRWRLEVSGLEVGAPVHLDLAVTDATVTGVRVRDGDPDASVAGTVVGDTVRLAFEVRPSGTPVAR